MTKAAALKKIEEILIADYPAEAGRINSRGAFLYNTRGMRHEPMRRL